MPDADSHIEKQPALYERIILGDQQAFGEAHAQYKARLFFYARRFALSWHEVEDIVADAFVALWQARGQLQSDTHLQHLLFFAVRNKALNRLESRNRQIDVYREWEEKRAADPFDDNRVAPEMMEMLHRAVRALTPGYRRIFELSYYQEKSPAEIARLTGTNPATVRSQKRRAIRMIREWIVRHSPVILLFVHFLSGYFIFLKKIILFWAR